MGQNDGTPIKMIINPTSLLFGLGFLATLTGVIICSINLSSQFILFLICLSMVVVAITFPKIKYVPLIALHVEKLCYYLTFLAGFTGAAFLPIDIGLFTLFPYRFLLVILMGLFITRAFVHGKIILSLTCIKPYMTFFGFWLTYAIISLTWAASKGDAVRHIVFLFLGIALVFFGTYYFRSFHDLNKLFWIWLGAFCALTILGYWEHLTGNHLVVSAYYGEVLPHFMNIPTGVFRNPNDYATFLSLSIPFSLSLTKYADTVLEKLTGIGLSLVAFYLIVVTGSRANILAVLLVVSFLLLFLVNLKQKVRVAVIVAVFLAIVLLLGLSNPVRDLTSKIAAELSYLINHAIHGGSSVAIRANLVRNGLYFLLLTGGIGVGAGNAEYWIDKFSRHETFGILNLHNWWLEILTNYGIIIFICYLAFYISIILKLWTACRKAVNPKERMISESLLLALIGFSVASISSSSIMAFNPHWMLIAFAIAFLNCNCKTKEEGTV